MATETEFSTCECNCAAIDWDVLGALAVLRKQGAPDLRTKLIKIYLDSAAGLIDRVGAAVRTSDGAALAEAAHSLKSGSTNVGATGLGMLCAELERAGKAGVMREAEELLLRTMEQYSAVTAAFENALLGLS